MYRVSIELQKHEWKFGRTRNAVGTRAIGKRFHSFFKFSQTFTSISITPKKHGVHVFYNYLLENTMMRERKTIFVNINHQNVNSLYLRHSGIITSTVRASCVCPLSYRNTFLKRATVLAFLVHKLTTSGTLLTKNSRMYPLPRDTATLLTIYSVFEQHNQLRCIRQLED